jgi:hypothetical protein
MRISSPSRRRAIYLAVAAAVGAPGVLQAISFGTEFRVNTYTTGGQGDPATAIDSAGDFVVVWASAGGQDGSGLGVYGQRYSSAGGTQGSEFRVNTYTTSGQAEPSVAMDSSGNFVVVWESNGQDGDLEGIYGQRYNAAGVAQGSEFKVNTFTTGAQRVPDVAMDSSGDFVVVWTSQQGATNYEVIGQRFNAAGVAQGSEFQVNTNSTGISVEILTQGKVVPAVAMDDSGNFIVAWHTAAVDVNGNIAIRSYNAAGVAQSSEATITSYTSGSQLWPDVAMDSDGDFVVTWTDYGRDGDGQGIYARRGSFTGSSAPTTHGNDFAVNETTANDQDFPAVALDNSDNIVITWTGDTTSGTDLENVYGRQFKARGSNTVAVGGEFQVNAYTTRSQDTSAIAMDIDGDFVVAWESYQQDGSFDGVYSVQAPIAKLAEPDFDGDALADIFWRKPTTGYNWAYFMDGMSISSDGTFDNVAPSYTPQGLGDFDADGKTDILWRNSAGLTWFYLMDGLTVSTSTAGPQVDTSWQVVAVDDFDGDGDADIMWRKSTGATWFYLMNGASVSSQGAGQVVSTSWSFAGVGDFDGDRKDDIFWRNAAGSTWIHFMNGISVSSEGPSNYVGTNWYFCAARDFDGDGKSDILWRRDNGLTWIYLMNGATVTSEAASNAVSTDWQVFDNNSSCQVPVI